MLHQALLEELGATLDGLARDIDMLASSIALILSAQMPTRQDGPNLDAAAAGEPVADRFTLGDVIGGDCGFGDGDLRRATRLT